MGGGSAIGGGSAMGGSLAPPMLDEFDGAAPSDAFLTEWNAERGLHDGPSGDGLGGGPSGVSAIGEMNEDEDEEDEEKEDVRDGMMMASKVAPGPDLHFHPSAHTQQFDSASSLEGEAMLVDGGGTHAANLPASSAAAAAATTTTSTSSRSSMPKLAHQLSSPRWRPPRPATAATAMTPTKEAASASAPADAAMVDVATADAAMADAAMAATRDEDALGQREGGMEGDSGSTGGLLASGTGRSADIGTGVVTGAGTGAGTGGGVGTSAVGPVGAQSALSLPQLVEALRRVSWFRHLPEEQLVTLCGRGRLECCLRYRTIIREGNRGRYFYVLLQGHVHCTSQTKKGLSVRLGPGAAFGEGALVTTVQREASVVALEPCRA